MFLRLQIFLLGVMLSLVVAGCTTSPYLTANWNEVGLALQPGMTPEQVKTLLGEPTEINDASTQPGAGGIITWVYKRKRPAGSSLAQTGIIEVPWVDPITGEMKSEKQPDYTPVNFEIVEEFHLYWRQGHLYHWQRFEAHEQRFL